MNVSAKQLVFALPEYQTLADEVVKLAPHALERGNLLERKPFKDGELYHCVDANLVRGRDTVLIGATFNDAATMELFDMACMLRRWKAHSIKIILTYFGYSTMERAVKAGEDIKAKNRALLFSAIPKPQGGLTIAMVDLHSEGIPEYFENGVDTEHLYAKPQVFSAIELLGLKDNYVLGCTDAGRAKWVQSLALELGVGVGIVLKRRTSGTSVEKIAISARVRGKDIVIFDDMIRTGSTLINAALAYRARGAGKIYVVATHGVLPGDALKTLENVRDKKNVRLFTGIVITNSHHHGASLGNDFLKVQSIAPLLANYLERA